MGREVCLLELAAYCRSRLVQSCLLEEDLLGGDWYCVVETSTAAAGKRRLLLVLPLQLRKGVAEERKGHLAAEGETGCDLYHLCVEMATAQNPPHLPIIRDFGGSGSLASA